LAAGTVLDVAPDAAVDVAAAAGFPAVGLWFDGSSWTSSTTKRVAERLRSTGVTPLDIEPVILGRGPDLGDRMIDVAAELGVRFLLLASGAATRGEVVDRLGELSRTASSLAPDLVVVLEFLPIFSIGSLEAAVDVVNEVAQPNVGVLVDTLHLARSGGHPDDLRRVAPALLPYLQLADAVADVDDTLAALRDEALHGRLLPGEGVLPLLDVLGAVPNVPVSIELRSRALMSLYPDPVERARAVLRSTRSLVGAG